MFSRMTVSFRRAPDNFSRTSDNSAGRMDTLFETPDKFTGRPDKFGNPSDKLSGPVVNAIITLRINPERHKNQELIRPRLLLNTGMHSFPCGLSPRGFSSLTQFLEAQRDILCSPAMSQTFDLTAAPDIAAAVLTTSSLGAQLRVKWRLDDMSKTSDAVLTDVEALVKVWEENTTLSLGDITLISAKAKTDELRAKDKLVDDARTDPGPFD
jgi:hypothetical protein